MAFRKACMLLVAATQVFAAPLEKRATINVDDVVGFPETVPNSNLGNLYLRFKPHLYVANGCVPFPAVDAEGNVSGGLNPTGPTNGDCASSTGQIYTRSGAYGDAYGIMYSWFMPKDEPENGIGHRYDWENIVVWIDNPNVAAPKLLGVAASAHGDYQANTSPSLTGTSPLIEYISYFPIDHQLAFTSTVGGQQPLVAWENLTTAARNTLNSFDFGSGVVPFKDSNFNDDLAQAAAGIVA
ncbi:MAG: hypothetical protein Q9159_003461 [Coniocarpon cinnabarinum]